MYEVIFDNPVKKQLKKLNIKLQNRIISTIERIKIRPHYFVKSLLGSPYFRLRFGDYRIILDIK